MVVHAQACPFMSQNSRLRLNPAEMSLKYKTEADEKTFSISVLIYFSFILFLANQIAAFFHPKCPKNQLLDLVFLRADSH